MEKYYNSTLSKNKIVSTIANRKTAKNNVLFKNEYFTAGYIGESMAEWKGLLPDEQVVYIVGRQEMEGLSGFDKKGFDNYKDTVYKLKHIKDNQEEVEKQ